MKGNPMKKTRILASVTSAVVLVTGATAFAVLGGGGSATAAGIPSSAFGLELEIAGNTAIDATPSVTSTDGKPVTDSLIALPSNPLVTGGVINASAENGKATANVAGLGVGDGLLSQLPAALTGPLGTACQQLTAVLNGPVGDITTGINQLISGPLGQALNQLATATGSAGIDLSALGALDLSKLLPEQLDGLCDVLSGKTKLVGATAVEAQCTGDTGTTTIADLKALGLPVNIDTNKANASVSIPGLLTLTVNRQTKNADGTFTVDALYLNLLGQVDLTVASATCGNVTTDTGPTTPTETDAPTPTPVESHVPVTG